MSRLLFGAVGVLVALAPNAVIDAYEAVALENPHDCTAKPWLEPAVRAEGVVYALAGLAGGRSYAWVMNVAGVAGLVAALAPKRYLEFGAAVAYENGDEVVWKDGVTTAVRVLGAAFVVLAVRAAAGRRDGESATEVEIDESE
ncbi:hypothetical protein [Natrarchaeobius oligotrophus]|uniref:hypothetical protein n=1 Tax=Natrarchaeobius oligotrophus TaxID=3455743 RepID=UPI001A9D14C0|nr:hypothetical protein [Natrarchaeobius chitinivorans]